MIAGLLVKIANLVKDQRGGVAPLLALLAIPMLASVGVAVDYGRATAARTAMQSALDSTALNLAKQTASGLTSQGAQQTFAALLSRPEVQNIAVASQVTNTSGVTIALSATGTIQTSFLSMIGYPSLAITVNSAVNTQDEANGCVLALNKTVSNAVVLSGSTNVNLSNCSLYADSNSKTALVISGSAALTALSAGVVGNTSISSSNVNVTNGVSSGISAVADPYSDVQVPAFGGCDHTNYKVASGDTLDPGVYCGGISASVPATLNPGIYYIDGGTFSVAGGGSISGAGVTLLFTSKSGKGWGTAAISGGSSVNLTAPLSGPTAGLVMFADPNTPVGTKFSFSGGGSQIFGGAIYIPTGALSFTGGSGTSGSCTQIIGDTVTFSGNSSAALNCSGYKIRPIGTFSINLVR